jgi:rhodanese-related sulfurtransferase
MHKMEDRMFRKIGAFVTVFTLLACGQAAFSAENWPDSFDQYVLQVRKTVDTIDMEGFLAVVKNPNGALLVDVRDESEVKAGHIPGTINLTRGRLETTIWKVLGYPKTVDLNRKIYVHCASGTRATLAARQLKDIGFTNVTAVVMPLVDWQRKGYPFVKDEAK